jgi:hypothetical protein
MDINPSSSEGISSLDYLQGSSTAFPSSSSSSFRPSYPFPVGSSSIFEAPSSVASLIPFDGHGKPPKRMKDTDYRQDKKSNSNRKPHLFSPNTEKKPSLTGIQEADISFIKQKNAIESTRGEIFIQQKAPGQENPHPSHNYNIDDLWKPEYNPDSNYLGSISNSLIIHDNYPYPLLDRHGNTISSTKYSTESKGNSIRPSYASPGPSVKPLRTQSEADENQEGMGSPTQCKCKKSRCLKLYCDCFALLKFCGPKCRCYECQNIEDPDYKEIRESAITATTKRTANAFTSKVTPTTAHVAGCHCSKTNCLKKYCECFLNFATCGLNCKCQSCKNYPTSEVFI